MSTSVMLFLSIAAIDSLLIIGLLIWQLAKDGALVPIKNFILKMSDIQMELRQKVFENGVAASILSFAYAIITAQPRNILLASVLVWVVCLACLAKIKKEEV